MRRHAQGKIGGDHPRNLPQVVTSHCLEAHIQSTSSWSILSNMIIFAAPLRISNSMSIRGTMRGSTRQKISTEPPTLIPWCFLGFAIDRTLALVNTNSICGSNGDVDGNFQGDLNKSTQTQRRASGDNSDRKAPSRTAL